MCACGDIKIEKELLGEMKWLNLMPKARNLISLMLICRTFCTAVHGFFLASLKFCIVCSCWELHFFCYKRQARPISFNLEPINIVQLESGYRGLQKMKRFFFPFTLLSLPTLPLLPFGGVTTEATALSMCAACVTCHSISGWRMRLCKFR